ncbi:hypothetical protein K0U83_22875 [bacterium]|nr:hypothetical protein [bacterium]
MINWKQYAYTRSRIDCCSFVEGGKADAIADLLLVGLADEFGRYDPVHQHRTSVDELADLICEDLNVNLEDVYGIWESLEMQTVERR